MSVYYNLSFYIFTEISDPTSLANDLKAFIKTIDLKGTLIFGKEGLNGYVSGELESVSAFVNYVQTKPPLTSIDFKVSISESRPFRYMKIKVKPEIVTMGTTGIDPTSQAAPYVTGKELNEWLDAGEDLILVDTRNQYETVFGTFRGAMVPNIRTFREFPAWVEEALKNDKKRKIVTFCTGGIRCEKATAYMRNHGFENVFQVRGGILKYLEESQSEKHSGYFEGECFVFDDRISIETLKTDGTCFSRSLAPERGV